MKKKYMLVGYKFIKIRENYIKFLVVLVFLNDIVF